MSLLKRILLSGLLVGTLDIVAACTQYYLRRGKGPEGILRFVASGLFGKDAFTGGTFITLTGLAIYYFIAMSFTILFFLLAINIAMVKVNCLVTVTIWGFYLGRNEPPYLTNNKSTSIVAHPFRQFASYGYFNCLYWFTVCIYTYSKTA